MEGQATQSARATICVIDPMGGTDPGLAQVFTTLLCERLLRKDRAQLGKLHLEGEDRFI